MNALDLVAALHGILGELVGASGVSIHAMKAWTVVLVTAVTDDSARALGAVLGLGAPKYRTATDHRTGTQRCWVFASTDLDRGAVRVQVVGPSHAGPPPSLE
jgi:hypothetical protein